MLGRRARASPRLSMGDVVQGRGLAEIPLVTWPLVSRGVAMAPFGQVTVLDGNSTPDRRRESPCPETVSAAPLVTPYGKQLPALSLNPPVR